MKFVYKVIVIKVVFLKSKYSQYENNNLWSASFGEKRYDFKP